MTSEWLLFCGRMYVCKEVTLLSDNTLKNFEGNMFERYY